MNQKILSKETKKMVKNNFNHIQKLTSYFFVGIFLFSFCKNEVKKGLIIKNNVIVVDTFPWSQEDTIAFIYSEIFGTSKIEVRLMKRVIQKFPDLLKDTFVEPNNMFIYPDKNEEYDPELESDKFLIYTYLLRSKLTHKYHDIAREHIKKVFFALNGFHKTLNNGGTGYMDMLKTMPADIEYRVQFVDSSTLIQLGDLKRFKQSKTKFITGLKLMMEDYTKNNFDLTIEDKKQATYELKQFIKYLDKLITNSYFLEEAIYLNNTHYGGLQN